MKKILIAFFMMTLFGVSSLNAQSAEFAGSQNNKTIEKYLEAKSSENSITLFQFLQRTKTNTVYPYSMYDMDGALLTKLSEEEFIALDLKSLNPGTYFIKEIMNYSPIPSI